MKAQLSFSQVKPFVVASLKSNQTPALMGEPGIGKSSLIHDLEREFKTKVFTLAINQLADRADLTGMRMVETEGGSWGQKAFPHFRIMEAVEYAQDNPQETPILFLDEFNRASSDITSSVLSLQTDRAIGSIKLPDNLRLIVAGNDKGNVTSLDAASISRFAVYRVMPDIDTFLGIQKLNPFVTDVLTKHPEDLMADEVMESSDGASADEDEDDENEAYAFSQFEFLAEDSFSQITRPRTITAVSRWLNTLGLNKSGSDEERQLLGQLFTDMTENNQTNSLFAGIEAHVGNTTFAHHLYDEINNYFNTILTHTHTSNQPILQDLRPAQDYINSLSRAQNVQEVEEIIDRMNDDEVIDTVVWLTESASTKEINNNQAVETFMSNAPHRIGQFENKTIQNLMKVLPDSTKVSVPAVTAMLGSSAPVINQWRGMIQSVVDQD